LLPMAAGAQSMALSGVVSSAEEGNMEGVLVNARRVGANKTVTVTGIGLTGSDAANYHLFNTTANATASITGVSASAYRITALNSTLTPSVGTAPRIALVDAGGSVMTNFNGDKNLTFSGLAVADDGTKPTVTDKGGAAVALGQPTTITFAGGISTVGGTVVAYKGEGPVTLNAQDDATPPLSTTTPGGAGLVVTVPNVNPVVGIVYKATRTPGLSLKILITEMLGHASISDANHDVVTLASVTSPSTQGAIVVMNPTFVGYLPGASSGDGDTFTFTVADGHGGTGIGTAQVNLSSSQGNYQSIFASGGVVTITFRGIPGIAYDLQRATQVIGPWVTITAAGTQTAGADGSYSFSDTPPAGGIYFYRSVAH